jgi:SAM-dependent methyltransferase
MFRDSRWWDVLTAPLRRARWRFARWSSSSDRTFHDDVFRNPSYDPFSPSYPGNVTIRRFADLAGRHCGGVRSILDLGCGPGEITCELARRYPDIRFAGIDHSAVAIEVARAHAAKLKLDNVRFEVHDVEGFVPSEPVDLIVMFDAFHHLLNPQEFVARMGSRCSRFFLVEPAGAWTGDWDRARDFDWLPATIWQIRDRLEEQFGIVPNVPKPARTDGSDERSGGPTEHRYTAVDFERFFAGFSIEVGGTVAGLEWYGPTPALQSGLRDSAGRLVYDLVVGLDELLAEHELQSAAKHWTVFAVRGGRTRPATMKGPERFRQPPPRTGLMPAYGSVCVVSACPTVVKQNEIFHVTVRLTNTGWKTWDSSSEQPVMLSYHWLDASRRMSVKDGLRSPLPKPFARHDEGDAVLRVQAPGAAGRALLWIDLVHEGVTWFADQGVPPCEIQMEVVA